MFFPSEKPPTCRWPTDDPLQPANDWPPTLGKGLTDKTTDKLHPTHMKRSADPSSPRDKGLFPNKPSRTIFISFEFFPFKN